MPEAGEAATPVVSKLRATAEALARAEETPTVTSGQPSPSMPTFDIMDEVMASAEVRGTRPIAGDDLAAVINTSLERGPLLMQGQIETQEIENRRCRLRHWRELIASQPFSSPTLPQGENTWPSSVGRMSQLFVKCLRLLDA